MRSDHFYELIEAGLMPNFSKLIVNGISSKCCITDFPSITFPTQVSMVTGTYTGDYKKELCHGVPLSNWMERNKSPPLIRCYGANNLHIFKMNDDLGLNCQTIFEMIEEEGNTSSIIQFINRGADYIYPENKLKFIYYYLLLKSSLILKNYVSKANTQSILKLLDNFKNPKKYFGNNEAPIVSFLLFFSSDLLMHSYGYKSQLYKLNFLHIDEVMGLLIEELDKIGYMDDTAIVVASDHGNYKAKEIGNINSFIKNNNLTHYHPLKNLRGNLNLAEYGGVGFFNFKGISKNTKITHKYNWLHPTIEELENFGPKRINLIDQLFKIKGSHLMYYRNNENTYDKGLIHLRKKDLKTDKTYIGSIEYKGSGKNLKTKYISENEENDIFGYAIDEKVNKSFNQFHSINEWMELTYHLNYPIYPDLVVRHFKNPRSSDLILSNDGSVIYNIEQGKRKNNNLYTHDLGTRSNTIVPLIIGGSLEIPHKEIPFCKTTDIVPTVLKMLGKTPHKSVIGDSLI